MAIAPARFELEMKPGSETTVVVNVDYKSAGDTTKPARIVASLNDWTMTREGQVDFFPAGTRGDSASSWMIYSPGEAAVMPGTVHKIRVTVSVPANAAPGDHVAALIIEQRPENLRAAVNARQMVVRYRMASVFYIKVGGITRKGDLKDLFAEATPDGIVVTPLLSNTGNSVVRPTSSLAIFDAAGTRVADIPEAESLPVLAASESAQVLRLDKQLPMGKYTVKYRVDFQDGRPAVEGLTDLVISAHQIARGASVPQKP
jgi:methionine-rich copper-binding protein CopC